MRWLFLLFSSMSFIPKAAKKEKHMIVEKLERIQIAVENFCSGISSALVGVMMFLTTADVVLRYIFNKPLHGVFVLCEMLMVGTVYFGIAYVQQKKGHVRVDIFIDKIKGIPRTMLELSILFLSIIAFSIMFWKTASYGWEAWVTSDHTMGLIEYPLGPPKLVVAFGVGLLCLRFITDTRHHLAALRESRYWGLWAFLSILPTAGLALFLIFGSSSLQLAPSNVGWIFLIIMIVLLLGGLPVSFSLLILAIVGYWTIAGPERTLSIVGIIPYDKIANYTLSVVPLFILMGNLAFYGGFVSAVYSTAQKWVGHIPGGLAQATVVGGAGFAAACGSGLASCATLAKICIPPMLKGGIDRKLAIGTIAATGPIAQMIPPSLVMVIIAVLTDQSVGKLLIAGIIPGIVAAINFMILIYIRCKLNPELAPQIQERVAWKERFASLRHGWGILMIAGIVMGGIYSGIFTPTEAGALGAFGALILGLLNKQIKWENIKEALRDTIKTTAMIFLIIATALLFGYFLGISRIPAMVSDFIIGLHVHRFWILLGVMILYIIAGCFIDMLAFAFLTLPIIYPSIVALGYDPLWFGVLTVHMFEMSLITPPFGLNLFILRGMVPEMTMGEIIQGVWWFIVMDLVTLAIYLTFPQLATWLPSLM
jgi:tripartite ATP-independent transporter DctM subunit